MAVTKLQFTPGINKDVTTYSNEGGFYECDKIRFRSGFPEKIGGWINQSFTNTFKGVARSLWNWVTYASNNLLAVGTGQKYYIENGGEYFDITPIRTGPVTLGASPISVTSGSKLVTIDASAHGAGAGTYITITSTSNVGGLTISGEYEILTVPDGNTFTIASPTAATSTATGGGTVTVTYQINAGGSTATSAVGWGAGGWGSGSWGTSSTATVTIPLRLWSQANYGEDLLFAYRRGQVYFWDVDVSTYPRAILLSDKANTLEKIQTTATSAGAGTVVTVGSATNIDRGSVVISGTGSVAGSYVTAINYQTREVTLSSATTGAASGTWVFSYSGRYVPNETNQVFTSDISRFTICLGANPYDPTTFNSAFDPMLVRWSDQDNTYEWVPAVINQSGEQRLSNGSYLVNAQNTRQEILVWSDTALYSMQYLGPPYVFGFNLLMDNISIASPRAAVTVANVTYWMGVDKFYVYSGKVDTLPCTLKRFIFSNINKSQIEQVVAGTNEGFNEIWWFYPSLNSTINDSYVIYNYQENTWYYGSLNRTAWLDSPLRSYPMGAFSIQDSYLSQDIDADDTTITVLNAYSYPASGTLHIEDEQISYTGTTDNSLTGCTRGVNDTTAASHLAYTPVNLTVPNQVMFHEYGTDDFSLSTGVPISAYISSSDFDIGDGHSFAFVWRMLPDITFDGSSANNPRVYLTLAARQNSGTNYQNGDEPSVTRTSTVPVEQYTGQVYTRVRGRQMSLKLESTDLGTAWQMGAIRADIRPDGRR